MGQQTGNKRVSAIVPAFNEEKRLGRVLEVLTQCAVLHEVIVVDDGSTDGTEQTVRKFNITYLKNSTNLGKGKSMQRGVGVARGNVLFFCDADVKGLSEPVVSEIVGPVLRGEVDMSVGMRNRKSYAMRMILAFIPLLGGERALTRELWDKVPDFYKEKFRIEAGLNFYAKYYGRGFRFKVFRGLRQTIKEKKYGVGKGLAARVFMMRDYLLAFLKLQFVNIPKTVLARRVFFLNFGLALGGVLVGGVLLLAAWYGPWQFIYTVFAEDLRTESSTPIIHLLLSLAGVVSIEFLLTLSMTMIFFNAVILITNLKTALSFVKDYYDRWQVSVLAPQRLKEKEIIGDKKN